MPCGLRNFPHILTRTHAHMPHTYRILYRVINRYRTFSEAPKHSPFNSKPKKMRTTPDETRQRRRRRRQIDEMASRFFFSRYRLNARGRRAGGPSVNYVCVPCGCVSSVCRRSVWVLFSFVRGCACECGVSRCVGGANDARITVATGRHNGTNARDTRDGPTDNDECVGLLLAAELCGVWRRYARKRGNGIAHAFHPLIKTECVLCVAMTMVSSPLLAFTRWTSSVGGRKHTWVFIQSAICARLHCIPGTCGGIWCRLASTVASCPRQLGAESFMHMTMTVSWFVYVRADFPRLCECRLAFVSAAPSMGKSQTITDDRNGILSRCSQTTAYLKTAKERKKRRIINCIRQSNNSATSRHTNDSKSACAISESGAGFGRVRSSLPNLASCSSHNKSWCAIYWANHLWPRNQALRNGTVLWRRNEITIHSLQIDLGFLCLYFAGYTHVHVFTLKIVYLLHICILIIVVQHKLNKMWTFLMFV